MQEEGIPVTLAWVPPHTGIPPNEAADSAANIARTAGDPIDLSLSTPDYNERPGSETAKPAEQPSPL